MVDECDEDYDFNNEDDEQENQYDYNYQTQYQENTKKGIKWYTSNDIYDRLQQMIQQTKDTLNLNEDQTLLILRQYDWSKEKTEQNYFSELQVAQKKAGILESNQNQNKIMIEKNQLQKQKEKKCSCCLEVRQQFDSLSCGHLYCIDCWQGYILFKVVSKSPEAFFQCPYDTCNLLVTNSFILKYLKKNEDVQKYKKWLGKKFCEGSKLMKWCPNFDCDYAVENQDLIHKEITCKCEQKFCFKCGKENHAPCECKTVQEWELKNGSESENLRWIQLYTKMCPNQNCRKPIEKNQGCNHMTCRKPQGCGQEFCWICLGSWQEHSEKTGGYYKCNKFEDDQKKEQNIDKEKSLLEKYIFYFERFNNNKKSEENAKNNIKMLEQQIEELHKIFQVQVSQLQFLSQAMKFLIEVRKCLKWTYCYGFYIDKSEKEMFEHHQARFEWSSEQLHDLLEKQLPNIMERKKQSEFEAYKEKVVNLHTATEKYMAQILQSIENGVLVNQQQ